MYLIFEIGLGVFLGLFLFSLFFGTSNSINYIPTQSYYHHSQFSEIDRNTISVDGYTVTRESNHSPTLATEEEQLENEKIRILAREQIRIRNRKFDTV